MKRKLILSLVVAIFLFSIIAVQPVVADPHNHYDFTIGPLKHTYLRGTFVVGSGKYGSFTLTSGSDITFYIADEYNYDRAVAGKSYSRYCAKEDVIQGSFKFRIPYADTWYFVFCNADSLFTTQKVSIDLYVDTTAPTFSTNLNAGATYSGVRTITVSASDATFSVKFIKLYINNVLKKTEYDGSLSYNWDTKDYSNKQYTIRIIVSDNVNNERSREYIVKVDNYVAPTGGETTTGRTTTFALPNNLIQLGIVFGLLLILIIGGAYAVKRKGGEEEVVEVLSEQVIPKDVKVLVICPYCGAKTEQGIMKCQNCGADL